MLTHKLARRELVGKRWIVELRAGGDVNTAATEAFSRPGTTQKAFPMKSADPAIGATCGVCVWVWWSGKVCAKGEKNRPVTMTSFPLWDFASHNLCNLVLQ